MAAKAALALAELGPTATISIDVPVSIGGIDFSGEYKHDSTQEGWPVLRSDKGKYCYYAYHCDGDRWVLKDKFSPSWSQHMDIKTSVYIKAPDGPLPLGAHAWKCRVRREWRTETVVVTKVVRSPKSRRDPVPSLTVETAHAQTQADLDAAAKAAKEAEEADAAKAILEKNGESVYTIGKACKGTGIVRTTGILA